MNANEENDEVKVQTLKNGDSLDAKAVAAHPQQLFCDWNTANFG